MSNLPPPPDNGLGYSNYPRGVGPGGMYQRPPGIYFDVIGDAWRIVTGNVWMWVLITFLYFVVTSIITFPIRVFANIIAFGSAFGGFGENGQPVFGAAMFIALAINSVGYLLITVLVAGLMNTALRAARGQEIGPADLFSGIPRFGHVILAFFLMFLLEFAGFFACILPCIYIATVLQFVQFLVIDRNMTAGEALQASFNALRPHALAMFALVFVLGLVASLGLFACCVGILVSFPVYVVSLALTYNNFFPAASAQAGFGQEIGMHPPQ